ncbi:hypothetical protein PSAE105876_31000 [Pseudomonas aeruginosa]|nr:chemotactic transducer PctC [Pseudomonas aeruginosa 39016]
MVRGIGGVAGDFLGGGTEFVDRCGDAVGAVGLLVGVGHRGVRGVHHQLRHVVQLTGGAGDLADRFVDTLDEAVEGIGQRTEFIVAGDFQALGQVAFTLGDVLHGAAHVGERLHQYADQHAEEKHDADHRDQRGDDRRSAEFAEHRIGGVAVEDQGDVPGHAGQSLHRGEGNELAAAVEFHLVDPGVDVRCALGIGFGEGLQDQPGVGVEEDLAGVADQEGVAGTIELQGIEDRGQGLQLHVAGGDAQQLTGVPHRQRHGEDLLAGAGIDEGFGDDKPVGRQRVLVPGAGTWVVTFRHGVVGAHGEGAAGRLAKIDRREIAAEDGLFQLPCDIRLVGLVEQRQLRGQAFHQVHAAFQPALDVAGGQGADFPEVVFRVRAHGLALSVIVVEDEAGEGENHHQCGGEKDFLGKRQRAKHERCVLAKASRRAGSPGHQVGSLRGKAMIQRLNGRLCSTVPA